MIEQHRVAGVILAGGRSSRFRDDDGIGKAGHLLAGRPLLAHVVERIKPQVSELIINANDNGDWYRQFSPHVITDSVSGYLGPLAGLAAAMAWLDDTGSAAEALLLVPCDGPFVPLHLATTLLHALNERNADCVVIRYQNELQPTFSLWRRQAHGSIVEEFAQRGMGGFKGLFARLETAVVDWPEGGFNPFFNINTEADLADAETRLQSWGARLD